MCAQSLLAAVSIITAQISKNRSIQNNSLSNALSASQSGWRNYKKIADLLVMISGI